MVHLYYYEGYSGPEIAALLGKGESAVRMALMRARQQLRDFGEEGGNSCV
ncbi:RNA polymerase sigma factor [Flavonifractor sp. An306]|nr:sigma factor-like helix-turn-helix DNA-binding protein [Flavonifractor sp. An306]